MSDTITIRHTTEADREALRRLGDLDGGRAPAGPALAAYENGELVAAVGVEDGRTVADPFRYTAYLVRMLDLRIEQERRSGRRRPLRWVALGHRMGREGSAA
jgi:hypothetical protein